MSSNPATAELVLRSRSRSQTQAIAAALAECIRPGQIIALQGNLGAGKTTFVQGLAAGLGIAGPVSSPTFILIGEHAAPGGARLVHIDAYRLSVAGAAAEADALGLEEVLDDPTAVIAIEWAERIAGLLPADCLHVELAYAAAEGERTLLLHAGGAQSQAALRCLAERLA